MQTISIIKIGGNVIDDEQELNEFLASFANSKSLKILIHGGGKIASEFGKKLGIEPVLIEGRRITDHETLKLVTMVYAGFINKTIVAKLQSKKNNAFGICGADGNCIPSKIREHSKIDYGFVGDPDEHGVNTSLLKQLLLANYTPVIAPITHNKSGQLLNTNADTIASTLAVALSPLFKVHLVYCFEKNGVLLNPNNEESLIRIINNTNLEELKEKGIITGGMLPKLTNAFYALNNGVEKVTIGNSKQLSNLILQDGNYGTQVQLN